MSWDAKDKALLQASALVGFCESAYSLSINVASEEDSIVLKKWLAALSEYSRKTAALIDKAHESTDGQPDA
jgi:hypothetical protein